MKIKTTLAVAVLLFLGVGSYWHFSPHIALRSMQSAAESRDAEAFNEYVDFPALRESMKGQFTLMMTDTMSQLEGNPFAALGAMMGAAMVNQMVDGLVRPETVMKMMADGKAKPTLGPDPTSTSSPEPAASNSKNGADKWELERISTNKVIASNSDEVDLTGGRSGLVFVRSGFASWKLSEIRLPASSKPN